MSGRYSGGSKGVRGGGRSEKGRGGGEQEERGRYRGRGYRGQSRERSFERGKQGHSKGPWARAKGDATMNQTLETKPKLEVASENQFENLDIPNEASPITEDNLERKYLTDVKSMKLHSITDDSPNTADDTTIDVPNTNDAATADDNVPNTTDAATADDNVPNTIDAAMGDDNKDAVSTIDVPITSDDATADDNVPNTTDAATGDDNKDVALTIDVPNTRDSATGDDNKNVASTIDAPSEALQSTTMADIVAKSKLSPFAQEFVPRMNLPSVSSVSSSTVSNEKCINGNVSYKEMHGKEFSALLTLCEEVLKYWFNTLTEGPDEFDVIMTVITPHLQKCLDYQEVVDELAAKVLRYGTKDKNHAYFAAKIYCHLIETQKQKNPRQELVRSAILELLQRRTLCVLEQISCPSSVPSEELIPIPQFLMFLSELYVQLIVGNSRFKPLCHAILKICERYVLEGKHIPLTKRLHDVVPVLKLAGVPMDEDDKIGMNILCNRMWLYTDKCRVTVNKETPATANDIDVSRETVDENTFKIIDHLVHTRLNKWKPLPAPAPRENEVVNDGPIPAPAPRENEVVNDGPIEVENEATIVNGNMQYLPFNGVFYGPDGQVLSTEELSFLEEENYANALGISDMIEDSSPELNPNYELAFALALDLQRLLNGGDPTLGEKRD